MRRLLASWIAVGEFIAFLVVCVAGTLRGSLLWILIAALVLLLLAWQRYEPLFIRAGALDAEYRELAYLALRHGRVDVSLRLYARARMLLTVLGAKVGHDALFLAGAYLFGVGTGWFWGVP